MKRNIGMDHIQTFAFKSNFDDDADHDDHADDDDGHDVDNVIIIDDVDNMIHEDKKPGPFQVPVQA